MKTYKLIIALLFFCSFCLAQTKPKIKNYSLSGSVVNVVVLPFGMDNPIIIGTMSNDGVINFDFPKELINIPKEAKESESSKLWYTLFSNCDNASEMIKEKDNIFSFDTGALSLSTKANPYAGVVITVSDENLMPWIEDPAYNEPIMGSYYELIYVAKPYQYKGNCNSTRMLDEGDAQVSFAYDLNLQTGFNFIEYKIEHIYKTDPNIMASFPDKVSVTSVKGIPDCKWIGKYF